MFQVKSTISEVNVKDKVIGGVIKQSFQLNSLVKQGNQGKLT